MNDKTIHIKCEAKNYYQIDELIPFQGKLKSINKSEFDKLKKSLIKDGLPLAFSVWKQKDKIYLIDGHHRKLALQALSEDGYHIPSLPCVEIEAKTKKEAAKAVLISNSRYAQMSQESLSDFMIDMELNVDDLLNLDIPELNMDDFENNGEKNESENVNIDFKYKIEIDCENENQQKEIFEEMENRGFKVRVLI